MRDLQRPGRSVARGTEGAAASSHPLSTYLAIEVLRSGGNATDAALSACALQSVLEPYNTGIGGDCFALIWTAKDQRLHALDGSGWAPEGLSDEALRAEGATEIGLTSVHSVTVPGAVDAWSRLLERYGTRSLAEILEPTIEYAERGVVLAERAAEDWAREVQKLSQDEGARALFLTANGAAPRAGDVVRFPALAQTLRIVASEGRDAFYDGPVARDLVATLIGLGGSHRLSDFSAYRSRDVEPIGTSYRGVRVMQPPPSGQGLTALLMLNILSGYDPAGQDEVGTWRFHHQIEATRLAYAVRDAYVADPAFAEVPVQEILSPAFAETLRQGIDPKRAARAALTAPRVEHCDTVYVTVVDREGNVCSLINSLFHAFGSGKACAKTGIAFQNRGAGFTVAPGHPNTVRPRKRPLHTIMPGMAFRDGRPWLSLGVVGGPYQPVGQVHLIQNILDFSLDVQEALDLPRGFRGPEAFEAERGIPDAVLEELAQMGHPVRRSDVPLGGGQAILIDEVNGVLAAGSDPRKDGCAIAL